MYIFEVEHPTNATDQHDRKVPCSTAVDAAILFADAMDEGSVSVYADDLLSDGQVEHVDDDRVVRIRRMR